MIDSIVLWFAWFESISAFRSQTSSGFDAIEDSSGRSKLVEASANKADLEVEDRVVGIVEDQIETTEVDNQRIVSSMKQYNCRFNDNEGWSQNIAGVKMMISEYGRSQNVLKSMMNKLKAKSLILLFTILNEAMTNFEIWNGNNNKLWRLFCHNMMLCTDEEVNQIDELGQMGAHNLKSRADGMTLFFRRNII